MISIFSQYCATNLCWSDVLDNSYVIGDAISSILSISFFFILIILQQSMKRLAVKYVLSTNDILVSYGINLVNYHSERDR